MIGFRTFDIYSLQQIVAVCHQARWIAMNREAPPWHPLIQSYTYIRKSLCLHKNTTS
jgi:hypothetical protein